VPGNRLRVSALLFLAGAGLGAASAMASEVHSAEEVRVLRVPDGRDLIVTSIVPVQGHPGDPIATMLSYAPQDGPPVFLELAAEHLVHAVGPVYQAMGSRALLIRALMAEAGVARSFVAAFRYGGGRWVPMGARWGNDGMAPPPSAALTPLSLGDALETCGRAADEGAKAIRKWRELIGSQAGTTPKSLTSRHLAHLLAGRESTVLATLTKRGRKERVLYWLTGQCARGARARLEEFRSVTSESAEWVEIVVGELKRDGWQITGVTILPVST
jgi:hypothetical protein